MTNSRAFGRDATPGGCFGPHLRAVSARAQALWGQLLPASWGAARRLRLVFLRPPRK